VGAGLRRLLVGARLCAGMAKVLDWLEDCYQSHGAGNRWTSRGPSPKGGLDSAREVGDRPGEQPFEARGGRG